MHKPNTLDNIKPTYSDTMNDVNLKIMIFTDY